MNHLKLRTVLITALALGAAQASLAAGGGSYYEPPTGKNGWQPAATTKTLPLSAKAQPQVRTASGR